jgi:hypothetical protein
MGRDDDELWRTLARIYVAVAACGVFVPSVAVLPVLVGLDSLFLTLCFGGVGLGISGGVVAVVDTKLDEYAAGPERDDPLGLVSGEPTREG